ncbi:hypothetical protein BS50DRAFT_534023 [Corynespora cassiicola Philippines]|uniref:PRP1 splicing factor N-terminal domain-containing protein n=1 Tax=Corynespora cassiicola Philippines TaxID=1448308 RepID=A0A2T2N7G8_CORCC|nr:hypothetical protein BS50DRAFT_534023 [Corynespora cassiicola Philippines]
MSGRRDFLSMPAPENYVAGLGRGATGFTTRSDLGPAREGPTEEQMKEMLAKRAAQIGTAAPTAYGVPEKKEDDEDDDRFQDPDNEVGLFSSGINYDKEDDEADRIYQEVDEKMDKRRRARREAREQKEREEYERNNPKIQLQFADLKRDLGNVTEEEWAALPDVGDMTGRAKRAREARMANARSYAVPDSVLSAASKSGEIDTSISASEGGEGTMTNFASIGAAQMSALQVRLDSAANTPGIQTTTSGSGTATSVKTVDPKGYITALDKSQAASEVPVEDINRARMLLESAVKTNIHNGPGYVALARLEEVAGRIAKAKSVIRDGCEMCPRSVVVWEEAIRLNHENLQNAKIIAAQGIKQNPKAIKLWLAAIELEQTDNAKRKVTRQALDNNPQSVELWKTLINLADNIESVRLLFAKATETVPLSEELWINYALNCEADAAQQVLNAARKAIPTSAAIWIQACKLQEQLEKPQMCEKIMERAIKALIKENAMLKREGENSWLEHAEKCEEAGFTSTATAIVKHTIGWGLEADDDRRDTWLQDAKSCITRQKYATARAILNHAASIFPSSTTVWTALIELERSHGIKDEAGDNVSLFSALERAVEACETSETLWLLYVRELWHAGKIEEARTVLQQSFKKLGGNVSLYSRAVEFEVDAGNYDQARHFLAIARNSSPTDRIFVKSAVLERQLGNNEGAIDFCNEGLQNWPGCWKLHAVKGQIYESLDKLREAEQAYSVGTRACSKAPVLYKLLARLQEKQGAVVKARSTLDRGRQQNPKNDELLCEAVRLERRQNNIPAAQKIMAAGLQECPKSALLWAESIMHLEARTKRKPRAIEASKKVENDPLLYVVIARIFWAERKLDKAASYFTKALTMDPEFGDAWVWYYKFLMQHGTEEKKAEVLARMAMAEPKYGEIWQSVVKDPRNFRKDREELLKIAIMQAD